MLMIWHIQHHITGRISNMNKDNVPRLLDAPVTMRGKILKDLPPDVLHVEQILRSWLSTKRQYVREVIRLQGGWEAWLQVELAVHIEGIRGYQGINAFVEREKRVYVERPVVDPTKATREKVDLYYHPEGGIGACIELKTAGREYDGATFASAVQKDGFKCSVGKPVLECRPTRMWAVAFVPKNDYNKTWEDSLKETVFQNLAEKNKGHYGELDVEEGDPVRVFWACTDIFTPDRW